MIQIHPECCLLQLLIHYCESVVEKVYVNLGFGTQITFSMHQESITHAKF